MIKIYGYFSTKDIEFTFFNEPTNEIKTYKIKKGDALYIGVDSNGERHANHLKPSKKHLQAINTFIQENDCWHYIDEMGSAQNKDLAHPIELNLINQFAPLFNIYGQDAKPTKAKLNLKDLDPEALLEKPANAPVISKMQRFNSIDEMNKIVDKSKMLMFTHKARNVVIVAAKDTGKSFPVDVYKLAMMERDPMASSLTLMKYSTKAGSKGIRLFSSTVDYARNLGYKFPQVYEPSTGFVYRLPKGKASSRDLVTKMKSQFIQFGSFEDSDDLANFSVSNGGYPFLIHVEEPVMQNDNGKTPDAKLWDATLKTITDTVSRWYRRYNDRIRDEDGNLLPHKHAPVPFKIITTMNDWDPDHIISIRTEKYHPQENFLDWSLGINYSFHKRLWRDKIIDSDTVVPELKKLIDENFETIKESVLKNHTQWVYVEKDSSGKFVDTLYGRMQKFANPSIRNNKEEKELTLQLMYNALITGDSHELARAFGMGYDGEGSSEKRFNYKSFLPKETDKLIKEEKRRIVGFSIAWDHDANRGPVATPLTLSVIPKNIGNPLSPRWIYTQPKVMIHPQVEIKGYGKGKSGQQTLAYHEEMIKITKDLHTKYIGSAYKQLEFGKYCIFDDDDGSYVGHIYKDLKDWFNFVDSLPSKNGKIETGGFDTMSRDSLWQKSVDLEEIIVDINNDKLVTWLKQVPSKVSSNGEKKRSTDGRWGERFKDVSNSAEYAFYPFRQLLFVGLETFFSEYEV